MHAGAGVRNGTGSEQCNQDLSGSQPCAVACVQRRHAEEQRLKGTEQQLRRNGEASREQHLQRYLLPIARVTAIRAISSMISEFWGPLA